MGSWPPINLELLLLVLFDSGGGDFVFDFAAAQGRDPLQQPFPLQEIQLAQDLLEAVIVTRLPGVAVDSIGPSASGRWA